MPISVEIPNAKRLPPLVEASLGRFFNAAQNYTSLQESSTAVFKGALSDRRQRLATTMRLRRDKVWRGFGVWSEPIFTRTRAVVSSIGVTNAKFNYEPE